jgi:hypothetical protein
LRDDYPDNDRLDELLDALSLYAPGQPPPYVGVQHLRMAIVGALDALRRERFLRSEPRQWCGLVELKAFDANDSSAACDCRRVDDGSTLTT